MFCLRIMGEVMRNQIQPLVATEGNGLVLGRRMSCQCQNPQVTSLNVLGNIEKTLG